MDKKKSNSIGPFTLWEKFSIQFPLFAGIFIAAYGLGLSNINLGIAYLLSLLSKTRQI